MNKLLVASLLLVGCGRESDPITPAQYKYININTVPTYYVEDIVYMPYCVRACDVMITKMQVRYWCPGNSQQWQVLVTQIVCELR